MSGQASPAKAKAWRCVVCGYIHEGGEPPEECPLCGAGSDAFEAVEEPADAPTSSTQAEAASGGPLKVLILGAGVAGVSAAAAAREASPDAGITLVSDEPTLPYYRINLTRYLAGEIEETELPMHPAGWYEERNIRLILGREVREIRPQDRVVRMADDSEEHYDRLILAMGARPFVAPIPGTSLDCVATVRSIEDARRILGWAGDGGRCVCIGGGILGLETAGALARRGMHVTVLEGSDHLMPRQLDARGGEILARRLAGLGVHVRPRSKTVEIAGDDRAREVRLEDGEVLPADLVVMAIGVRSRLELAKEASLETGQGVVVDDALATSDADIYAAGDVAEHRGVVYGLWTPAEYQGAIAGQNAVGRTLKFGGIPRSTTLKVLGVPLFSIGAVAAEPGMVTLVEEGEDTYTRLLFQDGRVVGAILLGDTRLNVAVKKAVESAVDLSEALARKPGVAELLGQLQ